MQVIYEYRVIILMYFYLGSYRNGVVVRLLKMEVFGSGVSVEAKKPELSHSLLPSLEWSEDHILSNTSVSPQVISARTPASIPLINQYDSMGKSIHLSKFSTGITKDGFSDSIHSWNISVTDSGKACNALIGLVGTSGISLINEGKPTIGFNTYGFSISFNGMIFVKGRYYGSVYSKKKSADAESTDTSAKVLADIDTYFADQNHQVFLIYFSY